MAGIADGCTVAELCQHLAFERGEQEFLIVEDPGSGKIERYSYAQFWQRAQQVANLFWARGLRPGDRVAAHLYNSVEFIECLIGAASIGAILVPLSCCYTADEVGYILDSCQVHLVVVDEALLPVGLAAGYRADQTLVVGQAGGFADYRQERDAQPTALTVWPALDPGDPIEIMFTSGTTAKPKGVMLTHYNLIHSGFYCNWQLAMRSDDRYLSAMAVTHVNFQLSALAPVLTSGSVLILERCYSASRFWTQVRHHRATLAQGMAMVVRTLLKQPPAADEKSHQLREMHYFLPITDGEKKAFEKRFNVRLLNNYGSTETLVGCITDTPFGARRWPSIGRIGLGYAAKVVDETGRELPPGQVGEIMIHGEAGRTLMLGYWGDTEETRRVLTDDGWLHTCDYGYIDANGWCYFVERMSDLIKRGGENISTIEVEEVLQEFPGVAEAAVIGVPDPVRDEAVKAFLVPTPGADIDIEALLAHCSAHLAPYKVPTLVQIVAALPRGDYGKVQKKLLAKLKGQEYGHQY